MTGKDPFPFGKHKGTPLDEVPKSYIKWWLDQDWASEKKDLYAYYTQGEAAVAKPEELKSNAVEDELLKLASPEFKMWWNQNYAKRLRGSELFVAHLRIALEAWNAAARFVNDSYTKDNFSDDEDPDDPDLDDLSTADTEEEPQF